MAFKDRIEIIKKIEAARDSKVVCYLTSLRPNVPSQMGDDVVRVLADHLMQFKERPIKRLDFFLCSNGGSGSVPWRIVSLLREFAKEFNVLLPNRAYSAATLVALGADNIVMHPFAEMGPIDPTVTNDFNPSDQRTGQKVGISVEDVKAYVGFIKSTVGITHEDELVKTIEILANKIHPLALGNVERFLSQSRLIARKILRTHMPDANEHQVGEIVETMASKFYFHGHAINRVEAKNDLKLKIKFPDDATEKLLWDLYLDYEADFKSRKNFLPLAPLFQQLDALMQTPNPQLVPGAIREKYELLHAIVESTQLSSQCISERIVLIQGLGQAGEPTFREDVIRDEWLQSKPDHAQKHRTKRTTAKRVVRAKRP